MWVTFNIYLKKLIIWIKISPNTICVEEALNCKEGKLRHSIYLSYKYKILIFS